MQRQTLHYIFIMYYGNIIHIWTLDIVILQILSIKNICYEQQIICDICCISYIVKCEL